MTDFAALIQPDRGQPARDLHVVHPDGWDDWLNAQPTRVRATVAAHRLTGKAGDKAILSGDGADDWSALLVCDEPLDSPWRIASQPGVLPPGSYRLAAGEVGAAGLGWLLAQHRFERYRKAKDTEPRVLLTGEPARIDATIHLAQATALVRDLIDTPASDMGPADLADAVETVAKAHHATATVTKGAALETGFPLIHAVGQAAAKGREPRLIELEWGNPKHPRIAVVGKGVCFDTGGLDIKGAAGMRLMKKDMGGAAHALALAHLVMQAKLPVRLHLLIPAVENAIAGNAARPGDVHKSRKGLTIENTNTDAEGRLVLADALTKAVEDKATLIIDYATLTGAARVALGPDLPPLFVNDEALAADMLSAADIQRDPLWRMPLWDPYDEMLKSDLADLVNAPDGGFAGAVTAALFLRRFVPKEVPWAHLDVFGWRPTAKPARPKGGEAYGLRASFAMLAKRFRLTARSAVMTKHIILGATGHVGSATARVLLDHGGQVVAIVHDEAKGDDLRRLGAEIAAVDLHDGDALRNVLRTGRRAFLLNPPAAPDSDTDAEEERTVAAILAALEGSGLEKVVVESTYGAAPGHDIGDSSVRIISRRA